MRDAFGVFVSDPLAASPHMERLLWAESGLSPLFSTSEPNAKKPERFARLKNRNLEAAKKAVAIISLFVVNSSGTPKRVE